MTDATTNPELERRIAARLAQRQAEEAIKRDIEQTELHRQQTELMNELRDVLGDLCDVLSLQPGTYYAGTRWERACATFDCRGYAWQIDGDSDDAYALRRLDQEPPLCEWIGDANDLLDAIHKLSQQAPAEPAPVAQATENTLPALFADIETELARIDQRHNSPRHSVGGWLIVLRRELREAEDAWACNDGDADALVEITQVAAVAVACLRQHGQPLPL